MFYPGNCIHYRAFISHETCKAGCRYEDLPRPLPCCELKRSIEARKAVCPLVVLPTPEQTAQAQREFDEAITGAMRALASGVSPCCNAAVRTNESGRHVTKACTACGKMILHGTKG